MKKIEKIKIKKYYVLLCRCHKIPLVCGIYASKSEAREVNKEIKGCLAKHTIRKCDADIIYY